MNVRRVVTGINETGTSIIVSDGAPPRSHDHKHTPGYSSSLVWATDEPPVVPNDGADPTAAVTATIPSPGGTRLIVIELPPQSVYQSEEFNPEASAKEIAEYSPGLLEYFEEDSPFHATPSVDYHVMLSGELWLLLEDGETCLRPGDIVIQNGTRHTWENRSDQAARFGTIPIGALQVVSVEVT